MDINSEMGMICFCYPLVTRSDFLARTRLRWSDNLFPHRVIVTTIVTRQNERGPPDKGII